MDFSKKNSIKSIIRGDLQRDERTYIKELDKYIKMYNLKLDKSKNLEQDIYQESERIINKYKDLESIYKDEDLIRLDALKYLLEELYYKEGKSIKDSELLYPEIGDKEFGYKLYHKKEFRQYKIPENKGDVKDLDSLMKDRCSNRKTSETQKLVKNFLSEQTPYNGLLIYHGVGVGKTCASIGIVENLKDTITNLNKKIYILVPPSIEDNYKSQIIDISKIDKSNDEIRKQCTKGTYMTDKFINKLKKIRNQDGKLDMPEISRQAKKVINKTYEFMGYEKFVNLITEIEKNELVDDRISRKSVQSLSIRDRKQIANKKIKEMFSDTVIIIDEAHNITMKSEKGSKKTIKVKRKSVEGSIQNNNIRIRNNNKKKSKKIKIRKQEGGSNSIDYYEDDSSIGESISDKMEDNIQSIKEKQEKIEKLGKQFPPVMKKVLKIANNCKLILLTATPMFNRAEEIVDLMNFLLINDNRPILKVNDLFENGSITKKGKEKLIGKISGYVSYLRGENPINFPQKLDPIDYYKGKYPKLDIKGKELEPLQHIKFLKIVDCEMTGLHWEVYQKYFDKQKGEENYFDTVGLQVCNIVFDEDLTTKKDDIKYLDYYYGTRGFKKNIESSLSKDKNLNFVFKNDKIKENFKLENLKNLSSKMHKIITGIEKSKGISFIYSQFKWGGVYPLAIALEMLGYSNYGKKNILPSSYNIKKNGKKYLLITGDSNEDFIKYKKVEHNNKDGDLLKVILGTKAAGEGLNILYVREVHVLEPWFHLNRLEQVIGRGIRNCSHKDITEKERNVTVYLYTVMEPKTKEREMRETLDMKLYRQAEEKIDKIGKVMEIIKASSIDCHLNKEGNLYLGKKWNTPIDMIDSRGNKRKVIVEDKPYSNVCNYQEKCTNICYPEGKEVDDTKIDNRTYRVEMSSDNIQECYILVKELFGKLNSNVYFQLDDIVNYVKDKGLLFDNEIIYHTLNKIVKEKLEILDKYGQQGYLIYRGSFSKQYYIFQPKNITKEVPLGLRRIKYDNKIGKIKLDKIITRKELKRKEMEKEQRSKNYHNKVMNFIIKLRYLEIEEDGRLIIDKSVKKSKQKSSIDIGSYGENTSYTNNLLVEKELDFTRYLEKSKVIEYIIRFLANYNKKDKISEIEKVKKMNYYDISRMRMSNLIKFITDNILEDVNKLNRFNEEEIYFFLEGKLRNLIRYVITNNLEYNRQIGFDKNMDNDFIGYRIANNNKIEFLKYSKTDDKFIDCNRDEISILGTYKNMLRDEMREKLVLSRIYGFIQSLQNKDMKFKIVDKTKETGARKTQIRTGYVCGTEKIENIRSILSILDDKNYINITGGKDLLCNSIELLMRYKNTKDEKMFFFNKENYIIYFNL